MADTAQYDVGALAQETFSSLMERRPTDGRHAPELEDQDDPEIDIDLTSSE